jgi:hypothetical protein
MKFTRIMAAIAMLSLVAIPAMAELTDYQKGVHDGLASGLKIGYLLGGAPCDTNSAQKYSNMFNSFNSWLQNVFGTNQSELSLFWMKPLSGQATATGYQAYPVVNSTKPVHSIDGSWNQSTAVYNADQKGKIYGYDPDTYYTMVGWPDSAAAPTDASGKPIETSLQPP